MKLFAIVFSGVAIVATGCATYSSFDAKMQQSMLRSVEQRSASAEFQSALKKRKLVFYGVGSGWEGLTLPGLNKEEVAIVGRRNFSVVNEFPTDPVPIWASQAYWDAVDRFVSAYNRLVYQYLVRKEPNQPVETTRGTGP